MSEPPSDRPQPLHRQLGLTDDELAAIVELLGREPTELELAMYAVMWSEHCSYKSSKRHLGRFPTEAPWVLVGPGRGRRRHRRRRRPRGGDPHREPQPPVGGRALPGRGHRRRRHHPRHLLHGRAPDRAHGPAALRPARRRPHALPRRRRRRRHQRLRQRGRRAHRRRRGRVRRLLPREPARQRALPRRAARSSASCSPRPKASATSRCCSARPPGATASAARACSRRPASPRATRRKRPSVQVGDPFEEKRLIEACLELLDAGLAVGVQDLGAAGISCAASETAAKTGAGMDVDLARMPKREPGMNGVEVMTSESQERMLAIVTPENLDAVLDLCAPLGDPRVGHRARHRHRPLPRATTACSTRSACRARTRRCRAATTRRSCRPTRPSWPTCRSRASATARSTTAPAPRPADRAAVHADDPAAGLARRFPVGTDLSRELLALLATPTIADKSWVYRQYDHQLFLNTVVEARRRRRRCCD